MNKELKGWKVLINRTRNDVAIVQAAIVFYLGYKAGLDDWWYWLLIPIYAIYKYWDIVKFHPQEADYSFIKNPKFMEMYKWMEEMHQIIKTGQGKHK